MLVLHGGVGGRGGHPEGSVRDTSVLHLEGCTWEWPHAAQQEGCPMPAWHSATLLPPAKLLVSWGRGRGAIINGTLCLIL